MPSVDPPGTPFSSSSPTTASATPTQSARGTAVPKSASARSGVKTTYRPGDEAGARDRRPLESGGLQAVRGREQQADSDPGDVADRAASAASRHANGASTRAEIANRTARNANSG